MRWLSSNPSKRWSERFVLWYSPIWIAVIVLSEATHLFARLSDAGCLAFGVSFALPLWLLPIVLVAPSDRGAPFWSRHVTRFNVFIAAWTFLQVYFGSDLFFDSLGMEYHFPTSWSLHRTPLFLYFITVAYFSTYYVVLSMAWRAFRTRFPSAPRPLAWLVLALLGYAVAFCETSGMATDLMRDYFRYRDKTFMLVYGSIFYGTVFVVSLPLFYRLDEDGPDARPLRALLWDACAANSVVLVCYAIYGALAHR